MKSQIFHARKNEGNNVTTHYTIDAMRKERRAERKKMNALKRENINETKFVVHPTKGKRRYSLDRTVRVLAGRDKLAKAFGF